MEFVLAGLIGTSCLVYFDDIVIFSRTFEEHLAQLREVLCSAGLKVKPSKFSLFKEEIAYLGHVVSAQGISTDPKKTEAIQDYPVPQNIQKYGWLCLLLPAFYSNFRRACSTTASAYTKVSKVFVDPRMPECISETKGKVYRSTYIKFPSF